VALRTKYRTKNSTPVVIGGGRGSAGTAKPERRGTPGVRNSKDGKRGKYFGGNPNLKGEEAVRCVGSMNAGESPNNTLGRKRERKESDLL